MMQDEQIVALFWRRDEKAIRETEKKYRRYLLKISYQILADLEDSKESVNDTYLKAWNSMPPHRPHILSTYLGRITRQVSIDIYRKKHRKKRQASEYILSLSELEECVSGGDVTQQNIDFSLLAEAINTYLGQLSSEVRTMFVGRYYYMDSVREVAAYYHMSESKAKSILHRTRTGLKDYLEREGFTV